MRVRDGLSGQLLLDLQLDDFEVLRDKDGKLRIVKSGFPGSPRVEAPTAPK